MSSLGTLTVLPPFAAARSAAGHVVLTRKFLEGMKLYAHAWPGPVKVVLHPTDQRSTDLDHVEVGQTELPFGVELCAFDSPELPEKLRGSTLVLGGPDYRIPNLVELCDSLAAACVFVTEYSLRTRLQIGRLEPKSALRHARHALWEANQERLTLQGLRRAAGVQCNGTPTYELYRYLSPDSLLYFDTRTDAALFATDTEMQQRKQRLRSGAPLTLAFSGRLIPMKGAEHIVEVAAQLKRRGLPFKFLIAGDGASVPAMRERISRENLHEVELLGVLPFDTGLMPLVRSQVDLFVACHRQGDPSCTYLETLAAGVPIVGYENEAFAGILKLADIGWGVPLDRPEAVADRIMRLSREQIVQRSETCLAFARKHEFEATFKRRIEHLIGIATRHRARRAMG